MFKKITIKTPSGKKNTSPESAQNWVKNRNKKEIKRFTLDMDADLHKRLKVFASIKSKTMNEIITNTLERYLATQEKKLF